jgi:protein SCO1
MTRWLPTALAIGAVALGGCGGGSHESQGSAAAAQVESGGGGLPSGIKGKPAPRMQLVDASTGSRFDTNSLTGRPYAVTFLYTHCRTTCPVIAEEMRVALGKLGASAKAAVVALSVDPVGDTPAKVRRFLRQHHEPAQFHYLIGPRSKLEPLWRAWYAAAQPSGAASSIHTAAMWFVDSRGRVADLVPAGATVAPATIASKFRSLGA